MQAAIVDSQGAPFRLATVARPTPAANQALVRIHASGVNPLDIKIHEGAAAHARHPLPAILGLDLAGTIEAVGDQVTHLRVGDQVYGMTGGVGGNQGSLAEYAAVDAALLARKPTILSMRQAAALPLISITAWEGLVDRARVSPGQAVLIHGGAGGIGHVAVQIARHFGATVFATGSAASRPAIEALGAGFIDYRLESASDYVKRLTDGQGFDIVFDTVGGATLDAAFASVRRYGHVVSALGWGTHALAPLSFRGATYSGVFTLLPLITGDGRAHHGDILAQVARLADVGALVPTLDPRRFTLATADDAHMAIKNGSAQGKIVIDIAAG
jgi:NADPH:quinone reductase-like Zn-dependent oxidoreductase